MLRRSICARKTRWGSPIDTLRTSMKGGKVGRRCGPAKSGCFGLTESAGLLVEALRSRLEEQSRRERRKNASGRWRVEGQERRDQGAEEKNSVTKALCAAAR